LKRESLLLQLAAVSLVMTMQGYLGGDGDQSRRRRLGLALRQLTMCFSETHPRRL
jgi:hypothetical protein